MDSALACCADGPGLIPAIGKSKQKVQMGFSLLVSGGSEKKWSLSLIARSSASMYHKKIIILATPSMGEHSVSLRNGKK